MSLEYAICYYYAAFFLPPSYLFFLFIWLCPDLCHLILNYGEIDGKKINIGEFFFVSLDCLERVTGRGHLMDNYNILF